MGSVIILMGTHFLPWGLWEVLGIGRAEKYLLKPGQILLHVRERRWKGRKNTYPPSMLNKKYDGKKKKVSEHTSFNMKHCSPHSNPIPPLFEPLWLTCAYKHADWTIWETWSFSPKKYISSLCLLAQQWHLPKLTKRVVSYLNNNNAVQFIMTSSLSIFHPNLHGGWFLVQLARKIKWKQKKGNKEKKGWLYGPWTRRTREAQTLLCIKL